MSNTLNTPIEALEREFPLRVLAYGLRRGSGGAGRHRGGDGVVRELQALTEMSYSLIAERRRHAPAGAAGGAPGAPGRDLLDGEPAGGQGDGNAGGRAADPHRNARWGRIRSCPLSGSASSAWGSWARGWRPTSPPAAIPLSVWTHTPGKAERWAAEHGAERLRHAGRGRGTQRHRA